MKPLGGEPKPAINTKHQTAQENKDLLLEQQTVIIPASEGETRLENFFPGETVTISPLFDKFIKAVGPRYSTSALHCRVFQKSAGYTGNPEKLGIGKVNPSQVCALLKYLGSEGKQLIEIPRDAIDGDAAFTVLGYVKIDGYQWYVFIENKLSHGVKKINLSMWRGGNWGGNMVCKILRVE